VTRKGKRVDYNKAHLNGVGRGEWGEAHILAHIDIKKRQGHHSLPYDLHSPTFKKYIYLAHDG
jgi:hypothetical protein